MSQSSQPASSPPAVPDGWLPKFDERYKTWYYVDKSTGKSQWEHPAPSPPGPPPPGPPRDTSGSYSYMDQRRELEEIRRQQMYQQGYLLGQSSAQRQQPVPYAQQPPGGYGGGYGGYGRSGPGWGGVALGAGTGLLGGMLLGEALDGPHDEIIENNYYDGGGGGFDGGGFDGGGFDGGGF